MNTDHKTPRYVVSCTPQLPHSFYAQISSSAPCCWTPSAYIPPSLWETTFHTHTKLFSQSMGYSWKFHNIESFCVEELLSPCPTPKMEDHSLLTVDWLFNIFTVAQYIGDRSSICNLRTCHAMITETHLPQVFGLENQNKLPYFPAYNACVIYTKRIWDRKKWTCAVYVRKISDW